MIHFAVLGECNLGFGEEESLARVIAARVEIVARNVTRRSSMVGDMDNRLRSKIQKSAI